MSKIADSIRSKPIPFSFARARARAPWPFTLITLLPQGCTKSLTNLGVMYVKARRTFRATTCWLYAI